MKLPLRKQSLVTKRQTLISMNARQFLLASTATLMAPLWAGEPAAKDAIQLPEAASRWRVGAAYAPLLGLKTSFTGQGDFNSPFSATPVAGGTAYEFGDGFVRPDDGTPNVGTTGDWGYQNNAQYDPAGAGSISFEVFNSSANGSSGEDGGGEAGVDLFGYYEMGPLDVSWLRARKATWGFRMGLHYVKLDVENSDRIISAATSTTYSFGLGSELPPDAPFSGTPNGVGYAQLDAVPTITGPTSQTAVIAGTRTLDGHLAIFNFGPYIEIPVVNRFSMLAEAGVSLGLASADYDYRGSTSVNGGAPQAGSGSASDTTLLPGAYAGWSAAYQLNKDWSLIGSARYQYLTEFDLSAGGTTAEMSVDSAYVLSIGAMYSF